MTERMIDGFLVRATTEPERSGAPFYQSALQIQRPGTDTKVTHILYATSQEIESCTREEALEVATQKLAEVTRVIFHGEKWDVAF